MVWPVVFEIVPAILTIDTVHSDKVSRVYTISKKFQPETWSNVLSVFVVGRGSWMSDESILWTFEHAREWRFYCFKFHLGNNTDWMDILSATPTWITLEVVTRGIKCWSDRLSQNFRLIIPVTRGRVWYDHLPKLIQFVLGRQSNVLFAVSIWKLVGNRCIDEK